MNHPRGTTLDRRLAQLQSVPASAALAGNLIGIEKEGLRVTPAGTLSLAPHPRALGSALTHPWITTDFSEALLEFITPPVQDPQAALEFLTDLHTQALRRIGDETLWGASMPCVLGGDDSIPLARYGDSNAGTMKTVYRRGLAHRYGRAMQTIAGVHFNFSFAEDFLELYRSLAGTDDEPPRDFRDRALMGMIRNLQRVGWIVPYLFGASPAVDASFVRGQTADLIAWDDRTRYLPHATSLRLGDIGYQNKQEECIGMKASYDSLDAYVRSLTWGIETPCPHYEAIGVRVGDRYEQLNAHVLQIENEYYSTVRPKQIVEWMERPSLALRRRGIRYVELRSLDINPFEPVGLGLEQLLFLDSLMLYCLLLESPRIDARERRDIDDNQVLTAHRGREPGLTLARGQGAIALRDWATELLEDMAGVAELLDGAAAGPRAANLIRQTEKVRDPEATPSAHLLDEMRGQGESFIACAQRLSARHRDRLAARQLAPERQALFDRTAADSWQRQREIEAGDDCDFETFLARYFAQG